ncbi:unnamed protein product, partial [marine sediment metagenome]
ETVDSAVCAETGVAATRHAAIPTTVTVRAW